jgi:hypothetical protein
MEGKVQKHEGCFAKDGNLCLNCKNIKNYPWIYVQMNLKEKLWSLKNYTLLLLGPSPFAHWFKSYKLFTVKSLYFFCFANQSSAPFFSLLPP